MAEKKENTRNKYKANPRLFEWVSEDSPDFKDHVSSLKKGDSVDLKNLTPERLKWCLDNELITKE
jgi:hypothetical protein